MSRASDIQLDDLTGGADASGFTIDYLAFVTEGLPANARRKVIANLTALPDNLKASNNPHVRRRVIEDPETPALP